MLVDKGAIVNEKDNTGDQPIHRATLQGHRPLISLLASCGANLCASGKQKYSFKLTKILFLYWRLAFCHMYNASSSYLLSKRSSRKHFVAFGG